MGSHPEEVEIVLFSTLSILQLIKDAQQQHGLRHGDYQRYRQYCSRKISRVRRSLHFKNVHKSVAKHPAKFVAKKLTALNVTDIRYFQVGVFEAERCWAYAMQLKQEMGEQTTNRKKFHMMSKLRKALLHTQRLERIARQNESVDSATKLETQAYNAWMKGCMNFEKKRWATARDSFHTARRIYEKLAAVVNSAELGELYKARCGEMQPQLRYCDYSIGDVAAIDELMDMRLKIARDDMLGSDLDKLIAETQAKASLEEKIRIDWAEQTVVVEQAKVQRFIRSNTAFEDQLKQMTTFDDKLALYEKLLIECRDAIQAVRDEAKTEAVKSRREDDSPQGQNELIHSYLHFVRLLRTADRYILMIDQTRKQSEEKKCRPQDMIRLYDTVIQNYQDIQTLPGSDMNRQLQSAFAAKSAYYKTFRCFYVAEAYSGLKKWTEALGLYDRTLQNGQNAKKLLQEQSAKNSPFLSQICSSDMDELGERVLVAKHTTHANELYSGEQLLDDTSTAADFHSTPILERLDVYQGKVNEDTDVSGARLLRLPPSFQAMPCKPLFFDLALNHIRMPNIDAKIDISSMGAASTSTGQQQKEAGLTGMVKGWFWGSSNK